MFDARFHNFNNRFPESELGMGRDYEYGPVSAAVVAAAAAAANNNSGSSSSGTVEKVFSMLLGLAFECLVIYSLITSNTSEVSGKCGDSLWKFMLSRLILFFFEGFFFMFVGALNMCVISFCACWNESVKMFLMFVFPLVCLIALHGTFVGVGFTITQAAMADSLCTSALSSVSFTNSPLLAFLGYVYVGLDSLMLFLITCGGLYLCCFGIAVSNHMM